MPIRDEVVRQKTTLDKKQDVLPVFRAVLCDSAGLTTGSGSVWADEDERLVWYRKIGSTQAAQVRCVRLEPELGLGVLIGYAEGSNEQEVLSDDPFLRASGLGGRAYLSVSGRDLEPGGRLQMWLYSKAFIPLATYPGTGLSVSVVKGDYEAADGTRKTFNGQLNKSIAAHQPAGPTEHCLVGIYLDTANALQTIAGATVATSATAPEPSWPATAVRLAVVDLDDTQTTINFADDIADRRLYFPFPGAGGWPYPNIITVGTGITADYTDLQDAINAVASGVLLLIEPGSWGDITIASKELTLYGLGGDPRLGGAGTNTVALGDVTVTGSAAETIQFIGVSIESLTATGTTFNLNLLLRWCQVGPPAGAPGHGIVLTTAGLSGYDIVAQGNVGLGGKGLTITTAGTVNMYSSDLATATINAGTTLALFNPLVVPTVTGAGTFTQGDKLSGRVVEWDSSLASGDIMVWNGTRFVFQPAAGGYPFTVLTVDATEAEADYSVIATAIAAASAGNIIQVGPASYAETLTLGVAAGLEGESEPGVIVQSLNITAAGWAKKLTVARTSTGALALTGGSAVGVVVEDVTVNLTGNGSASAAVSVATSTAGGTLRRVRATNAGGSSTNNYGLSMSSSGTLIIEGGYYSAAGTGAVDMIISAGTVKLRGPVLENGTLTVSGGTVTGWYYDGSGNEIVLDNTWLGLGSAAGRIEFDNQATDEVNILDANVGIGTATPAAKLDVDGAVAVRGDALALSNGLNSDIDITGRSHLRVTGPTGAFSVGGFTPATNGKILFLFNSTAQDMTIVNSDGSSTAANRILTLTGGDLVSTGQAAAILVYNTSQARWIVYSFNG